MKGYTERPWNDHEFAAWLRSRGAINHYTVNMKMKTTRWYDNSQKTGASVALAKYNNEENTCRIFILNSMLV